MPWVKSFDIPLAIDSAMQVFWQKGYLGTSMADLLAATGLNRGSLYNAFGSKKQLFIKALLRYERDYRRAFLIRLEALEDPKAAIDGFFQGLITESLDDGEKRGCLLVNTALELPAHESEICAVVKAGMRDLTAFFRAQIELGQARAQFNAALDPQTSAETLVTLLVGMRVMARGAFDNATLQSVALQAKALLGT